MSEATAATISEATAVLARSSRRAFLKTAAATAAGLTIGFHWSGPLSRALADTVQGLCAERLPAHRAGQQRHGDRQASRNGPGHLHRPCHHRRRRARRRLGANPRRIRAGRRQQYANLAFGTIQGTGGSSAMANSWMQLRNAGATARAMLVAAAAAEWKVPPASLTIERGVVRHAPSESPGDVRRLGRQGGEPCRCRTRSALKDPKDFKLIGQKLPRVDIPAKDQRHGAIHAST